MMAEPVTNRSAPPAKIAFFRSLFRGREDVFPRRFESRRTGKAGYSPVCANEWAPGVCRKPAVKCATCPVRRFLPVTDDVIRWHLTGSDPSGRVFIAGVCPMRLDETCFFLAADFDHAGWREDVAAVAATARRLGLDPAVERSRSGDGAHLWLFFEYAVPAALARKVGAHLLTETMEVRPDIGLTSYDRFFRNQDTLPAGGFGNLIALPLQRVPREDGHSLFLDENLEPCSDQWAYLSGVRKSARSDLERWAASAEARGRVVGIRVVPDEDEGQEPWATPPSRRRPDPPIPGPLPARIELVLGNDVYVPAEELSPPLRNRLVRLAAFQNPAFYRAQALRLPTRGTPRIMACAEDHPGHLGLPRGCLDDVLELFAGLRIACDIRDERSAGHPLGVAFQGALRAEQRPAAEALASHDIGVLAATTAFGKTVVAAWLIARRGVNTLVLTHRRQLMEQWIERLSAFLDLPAKDIGRIGGGSRKASGRIDVALIQSLIRKGVVRDVVGDYGHLIVDECHHLPAASFEQVARRARARFVLGLSATVSRPDGHHPIVFMQCGPVRYRVSAKQLAAASAFVHRVMVRPTGCRPMQEAHPSDVRVEFQNLMSALIADASRNRMICEDVVEAVREGRKPVVLTERTVHLEELEARLSPRVRHLIVFRGGMGKRRLAEAMARLTAIPEEEERVVLATGRFLGEGFDDARLDTLFLTLPISWRGTIAQYAGRLHRRHDEKREVRIYDYADLDVPMLARMFDRRCRGYEAIGYTLLLPASAVPGWPPEAPLPIDPQWKRDYAASVQRLIRDGVDAHLGNLFLHAARRFSPDATGAARARSATEAFLYRRLETLPETAGRFQLNGTLPIPLDGRGALEVNLLDAEARIAIEVDGPQHLDDSDAYRRDRRKDARLQAHGYFVLRFLAEDVGPCLDNVLDTILRTLSHRRSSL